MILNVPRHASVASLDGFRSAHGRGYRLGRPCAQEQMATHLLRSAKKKKNCFCQSIPTSMHTKRLGRACKQLKTMIFQKNLSPAWGGRRPTALQRIRQSTWWGTSPIVAHCGCPDGCAAWWWNGPETRPCPTWSPGQPETNKKTSKQKKKLGTVRLYKQERVKTTWKFLEFLNRKSEEYKSEWMVQLLYNELTGLKKTHKKKE